MACDRPRGVHSFFDTTDSRVGHWHVAVKGIDVNDVRRTRTLGQFSANAAWLVTAISRSKTSTPCVPTRASSVLYQCRLPLAAPIAAEQ